TPCRCAAVPLCKGDIVVSPLQRGRAAAGGRGSLCAFVSLCFLPTLNSFTASSTAALDRPYSPCRSEVIGILPPGRRDSSAEPFVVSVRFESIVIIARILDADRCTSIGGQSRKRQKWSLKGAN